MIPPNLGPHLPEKQSFIQRMGSKINNRLHKTQLSLKKLGFHTAKLYNQMIGNPEKVDQFKSEIDFLKHLQQNLSISDRTIVQASNIPRLSVLENPEKYTKQAETIAEGIFSKEEMAFCPPSITTGVCWGACIDFSRRLKEARQANPQERPEKLVLQVAKKYRYGVGKMGVAVQMCSRLAFNDFKQQAKIADAVRNLAAKQELPQELNADNQEFNKVYSLCYKEMQDQLDKGEIHPEAYLKLLESGEGVKKPELYKPLIDLFVLKTREKLFPLETKMESVIHDLLHKHIPPHSDLEEYVPSLNDLPLNIKNYLINAYYSMPLEMIGQVASQEFRPERFKEKMEEILGEDKDRYLKFFEPLIQDSVRQLRAMMPSGNAQDQTVAEVYRSAKGKEAEGVSLQLSEHTAVPLTQNPRSPFELEKRIAAKYGLELGDPKEYPIYLRSGAATEESYQAMNLGAFQNGVYVCSFSAGNNAAHAILFIKEDQSSFFWDPNHGLTPCSEDPGSTLQKIMQSYNADYYFGSKPEDRPTANVISFSLAK